MNKINDTHIFTGVVFFIILMVVVLNFHQAKSQVPENPVYLPIIRAMATLPSLPTSTPTQSVPTPTSTIPAPSGDPWLDYLNMYRSMANLPPVTENPDWSNGDWLHARYTVKEDRLAHDEDPSSPWYTPEGNLAASKSNVMMSSSVSASDEYAIDLWMRGPFHAVGMIDPALSVVGFGSYRELIGTYKMAAAVDVIRGLGSVPPGTQFPIIWPKDGSIVGINSHCCEGPSPLTSCPGYSEPSGLPVIVQIGPGNLVPDVTAHSFSQGGTPLEHCVLDETSYMNPNSSQQSLGRSVLNSRDAIVLIPRYPLTNGLTYTASITTNGSTYTWSFTVDTSLQGRIGETPQVEFNLEGLQFEE
jgi:uncharacterized protein YkwD